MRYATPEDRFGGMGAHLDHLRIFIGFDPNEMRACTIAKQSLIRHAAAAHLDIDRVCRLSLHRVYTRPTTTMRNGQLFDEISDAPMSTDHAIARFFIPFICDYQGWALFTDGDVLFRDDVGNLLALADQRCAIQVVHHPPQLEERQKKDGHIQQAYPRKNWSSVMLWNCGHAANRRLTVDVLNSWPGRDLHAFKWLDDDALLGELPARWNHLVGIHPPMPDPAVVHFTLGTPDLPGRADSPFAQEWFYEARLAGYEVDRQVGVL